MKRKKVEKGASLRKTKKTVRRFARRAGSKAKEIAKQRTGLVVGMASGAALGYAEASGHKLPDMIDGVDSALIAGAAVAVLAPSLVSGEKARYVTEAAAGIASVGAYRQAVRMTGEKVGEDDDII